MSAYRDLKFVIRRCQFEKERFLTFPMVRPYPVKMSSILRGVRNEFTA